MIALFLLLAQTVFSEPTACQKLRYEAVKLKTRYPASHDNFINCGPDAADSSNYAFEADPNATVEMHIISVQEGSFSPSRGKGKEEAARDSVQVFVYPTERPVLLVLSAAKPTLWDLSLTKGSDVDRVILQGPEPQVLRGVPDDLPVLRRPPEAVCKTAHGWEKKHTRGGSDYQEMITSLRCGMGLIETSFQGCRQGAVFEIPYYRTAAMPRMTLKDFKVCPLALAPEEISPLARPMTKAEPPSAEAKPGTHRLTGAEAAGSVEARRKRPPPQPARLKSSPDLELRGAKKKGQASDLGGIPNIPGAAAKPEERPIEAPPREKGEAKLASKSKPRPEDLPRPKSHPSRKGLSERAAAILLDGDLSRLNHDAVPDLIAALSSGEEIVRARAAEVLGSIRPPAASAVDPLIDALRDDSARVAANAALSLGNMSAEPAVAKLKRALKHKHPDVRLAAQTALERIGTPKALKALGSRRRKIPD